MDYSFKDYLEALETNWYLDDAVLQRLLKRYAAADATDELTQWGALCSGELADLARESARRENLPYLRHFEAHNNRVDEVILGESTERALAIVEGRHRMGALNGDPFVFLAKGYMLSQNGEAGVGCSLACTDGMIRALELLGDQPIHDEMIRKVRESTEERYYHCAQFITEIQGGSDAATNDLVAKRDGDRWTLHGQKWFCSNITADYFMMTARPEGAEEGTRGVGLFVVPAFRDDIRGERNGYRIDRLKEKLGTRELPTAEVTFEGAEAYSLGPLNRGLANVVSIVLVTSRFGCATSAASFLRSAERTALAYTDFRSAFGFKLANFPLVRETLRTVSAARERILATLFELNQMFHAAFGADSRSTEALDFRYMMSLCKPVLTKESTELIHECIMLVGGNGIEEEFCSLPRLWRDAIIMETWEGPHNVLFSQALRDMVRFEVDPVAFVNRIAGESRPDLADELGRILSSAKDLEATVPFAAFAEKLVRAFGERVVG